jgi:ATP-binding cassette, subfamily C, bacterial LapB
MEDKYNVNYNDVFKVINFFLIDFLKDQWKWVILLIIVNLIVFPSILILQPRIITKIIESLFSITKNTSMFDINKNIKNKNTYYFVYIFIGLWLFIILGHTIKNSIDLTITPYLASNTRKLIINNIIKRYKNDYKDIKIGEVIQRTQSITKIILVFWQFLLQDFLPMFLGVMGIIIYFSTFSMTLGLMLLCSILIPILLIFMAFDDYKKYSDSREQIMVHAWNKITDSLNNLMNIYINNNIDSENEKINKLLEIEAEKTCKLRNYENLYSHLLQLIGLLFFSSAIFKLFDMYKTKKINKTIIISSLFICNTFFHNVADIIWKTENSANWFMALMCYNTDYIKNIIFNSNDKNIKNNINKGKIIFDNISFKYNKNDSNYLFKDFSFTINSNDKVAIIGTSGSGKSTLMKMIIDLHRPQKGKIILDDVEIKDIDTEYLRNKVIYVNQRTALFDKSVMYNIKYGNETISDDKIVKLIQQYNLQSVYQELQKGLQSNCGVNGNNLSLGMQKTTIILRSILTNSKIIIMDEPLAGLDQQTRQKIIKLIVTECKNKTLIVITHDKEILPYMNKRINLQNLKKN